MKQPKNPAKDLQTRPHLYYDRFENKVKKWSEVDNRLDRRIDTTSGI